MDDLLTPTQIEARAKSKGLSLSAMCKLAGIAPSTFYRWKAGMSEPVLTAYRKMRDVTAPDDPGASS